MSWWPGWIGGAVGYALGGPLGALIGLVVGQYIGQQTTTSTEEFDLGSQARAQAAFFTATFSVMGHVAKSDGVVTQDEIRFGENLMASMQLTEEQRRAAISLYRQGKRANFRLNEVLDQFRYVCQRDAGLLRVFIEIQLQAACADGVIHPAQRRVLLQVCDRLGFSRSEFEHMATMSNAEYGYRRTPGANKPGMSLKDAYALLNIGSGASEAEVKNAYRRMLSRHHPDKLIAKGLPEEMIRVANEKTREIRKAYDRIRKAHGY
jgi:DnaJ like chaperone protein